MPAPTTLKLPDELKHRIAPLAQPAAPLAPAWPPCRAAKQGRTPHQDLGTSLRCLVNDARG
jgi:hypothetical protein